MNRMLIAVSCLFCHLTFADPPEMPLGVYWPPTLGFPDLAGEERWQKVEEVLESLQQHHVNTVWLNNGTAALQAEYARRAEKYGIRLVAAVSTIHTQGARNRQGYAKRVESVLKDWGDAPAPLAWGIGDEPYTVAMEEVAACARIWKDLGEPAGLVVMPRDIPTTAQLVPLNFIATDAYAFFGSTCPNGPTTQAQSQAYILDAMDRLLVSTENHQRMTAWFMGGAFQNIAGPARLSENGDYVILPGGQNNFRMPTPVELRWQSWLSVAGGARGIIMFTLFFYDTPRTIPLKGDWGLAEELDTGLPGGLLYPDGRPTAQYEAMGAAYARIQTAAPYILRMIPVADRLAFHAKGWPDHGDVVRNFVDETDGSRYVVVVNGNLEEEAVIPVNVPREYLRALDICSGTELQSTDQYENHWAPIGAPFRQFKVSLPPGEGTLLKLVNE